MLHSRDIHDAEYCRLVLAHIAHDTSIDRARVVAIDINGCHLDEFPGWLCESFPNVKTLNLHNNEELTALPAEIGLMTNLEELAAEKSRLTLEGIPLSITKLPKLKTYV
jgi:Leucine-rich repeat (LRR) protein